MLVHEACAAIAARDPHRAAFVLDDGPAITYAAVVAGAARIADMLVAAGIRPGDRVAFVVPRSPLGLIGFLGISAAATCCPVNPKLKPAEYRAFFDTARPDALLAGEASPAVAAAEGAGIPVADLRNARDVEVSALRGTPRVDRGESAAQARHALLMQTSGTTSRPKIVLLTHANVLSAARGIAGAFSFGAEDLCLNPMPLHHTHGLISAGVSSLIAGSAQYCTSSFSPESFDAQYARLRPTWFTGSPAMHIALREYYRSSGRAPDNPRLRFLRSSSAPLPASAIEDLERIFGAPLIETYGLTETASMISTNPLPPGVRKLGSVGVACGAEMRVVDDARRTLPAGETGEFAIRGPSVIGGYANADANTDENFADGWLLTGDLGYADAEGYFFITGRKKELIKRGGLSVYPGEIDNLLIADPRVAEAVTFSIAHPTLGEEVVAVVVASEGASVTGDELRDALFEGLSTWKVPTEIFIVPAIARTETGKVNRRQLAERHADLFAPKGEQPANAAEAALLQVWRTALKREDIGVTDNVFIFGADPIISDQVGAAIATIAAARGRRVSAGDIFRSPTVRKLARTLPC